MSRKPNPLGTQTAMTPDPSEQEIKKICEEIQADWSPLEREARKRWVPQNGTLIRPNIGDQDWGISLQPTSLLVTSGRIR